MTTAPWTTIATLLLLGCGAAPAPAPAAPPAAASTAPARVDTAAPTDAASHARAVVAEADRTEADRALDEGRKPAELLTFAGIKPGQRALDLCAGGGYTAELLARAVGPSGAVYGQNPKFVLGFAEKAWAERLATPAMKNAVRVDAELDAAWPPELVNLDVVTLVLFYHDTVWLGTDRAKLNQNVLAALKSGGRYVIVDHAAKAGDGVSAVKTLHRIEESVLTEEVRRAGFVLEAEGSFLREPSDTKDWSASPREAGERRGKSDRFVLRFKKP